MQLFFIEKRQQ
jgi:clathrin heavy chain